MRIPISSLPEHIIQQIGQQLGIKPATSKKRKQHETDMCKEAMDRIKKLRLLGKADHLWYLGIWHIPNESFINQIAKGDKKIVFAILKHFELMGVQPGTSDYLVVWITKEYINGLRPQSKLANICPHLGWIEAKYWDKKKPLEQATSTERWAYLSEKQVEFFATQDKAGIPTSLCFTADEIIGTLIKWGALLP